MPGGGKNKFPGMGRTIGEKAKTVAALPKKKAAPSKAKAPKKSAPPKKPAAKKQAAAAPKSAPAANPNPAPGERAFTRSQGRVKTEKRQRVVFATSNASRTLLAAAESYIAGLFEDTHYSAINARRATTLPKDIHLSKHIRGEHL